MNSLKITALIFCNVFVLNVYGAPTQINYKQLFKDYSFENHVNIHAGPNIRGRIYFYKKETSRISEEELFGGLMTSGYAAYKNANGIHVFSTKYVRERSIPILHINELEEHPSRSVASLKYTFENRPVSSDIFKIVRPIIPQWGDLKIDSVTNSATVTDEVEKLRILNRIFEIIDSQWTVLNGDSISGFKNKKTTSSIYPSDNIESKKVRLKDLIEEYFKENDDKTIIIDSRVKSLVDDPRKPSKKISEEEFLNVLLTAGFSAYTIKDIVYIRPLGKNDNIIFIDENKLDSLPPSSPVLTIFNPKNKPVVLYTELARPYIPVWGYIRADNTSNSLIAIGTVKDLIKVKNIISESN